MRIYEQALNHREPRSHIQREIYSRDGNNTSALIGKRQISASKLRISTKAGHIGLNEIFLSIFMTLLLNKIQVLRGHTPNSTEKGAVGGLIYNFNKKTEIIYQAFVYTLYGN